MQVSFHVFEKSCDEGFDEDFVLGGEVLPSVGDEFSDDSVVFLSAGWGAVFSEVVHFSVDSDEGSSGGFVEAVFGELFSGVGHGHFCKNKVSFSIGNMQ